VGSDLFILGVGKFPRRAEFNREAIPAGYALTVGALDSFDEG